MGKNGISDEKKGWEGRYRSHENADARTPRTRFPQFLPFFPVAPHPKATNCLSFVTSLGSIESQRHKKPILGFFTIKLLENVDCRVETRDRVELWSVEVDVDC